MDRQSLIVWLEGPHEPAAGGAPGAKGSRGRSHLGANGPASEEVAGGSVTAARAEPARTRCARAAGARRAAGRRATEARAPRAAEGARIDVISARALGDARTAGRRAARRSQRRGGERSRRTTASASAVRGSAVATVGSPCSCVWHRGCVRADAKPKPTKETTWKAHIQPAPLIFAPGGAPSRKRFSVAQSHRPGTVPRARH